MQGSEGSSVLCTSSHSAVRTDTEGYQVTMKKKKEVERESERAQKLTV
jgi:hypothetical protein